MLNANVCANFGLQSRTNMKTDLISTVQTRNLLHSMIFISNDSGRGTEREEDVQGAPTQGQISPSILVYEDIKASV